jgi:2'-phosphotransferase
MSNASSNERRRRRQTRKGGTRGVGGDVNSKESDNTNPSPDIAAIDRNNNHDRWADVQLSKSLSWVLRHAGPSLGLEIAPDGFVPLADVLSLAHPRFRCGDGRPKYTAEHVARVVRDSDKQRFRLDYKDDSSDANPSSRDEISADDHADDCGTAKSPCLEGSTSNGKDGVQGTCDNRVLCIRANQGHSLKGLQADQLLNPLTEEELSHPRLPIIHGTTKRAWEDHIQREGLSRMTRNHIHFATGLPPTAAEGTNGTDEGKRRDSAGPISGMRSSSEIHIYVNGPKCAGDGIAFYRSDNGVILTAGVNEEGMLPLKYFEKVVHAPSGRILWKESESRNEHTPELTSA